MSKIEYNGFVHLYLIKGNIYQEEDNKIVKLTDGYKMTYFKKVVEMKTRIYFEYGEDKYFYFDKEYGIIYFLVNEDDITLLKAFKGENREGSQNETE